MLADGPIKLKGNDIKIICETALLGATKTAALSSGSAGKVQVTSGTTVTISGKEVDIN